MIPRVEIPDNKQSASRHPSMNPHMKKQHGTSDCLHTSILDPLLLMISRYALAHDFIPVLANMSINYIGKLKR